MSTERYIEACSALRHYSSCIMNMRTTVIAQGIVLLTAAGYTLKLESSHYFYLAVSFGLVLTLVLWVQQMNYLADFKSHLSTIEKLESDLSPRIEEKGPWSQYKYERELREKNWPLFKTVVVYGPFVFFLIVFLLLAAMHSKGKLPPVIEKEKPAAVESSKAAPTANTTQMHNKAIQPTPKPLRDPWPADG
jgi:hypothetical protein